MDWPYAPLDNPPGMTMPAQQPSYLTLAVAVCFGAFAGAVLTAGLDALADGDPTTDTVPRVISYQGQLELNGVAVNASGPSAIPIRFDLYNSREGGNPVYTQELRLDVFQGRFTTALGPFGDEGASIADVVQAADALYLGMTLMNDVDNEQDDVTLANRQQLQTSPHALWSRYATNFDVASDLRVGGSLSVGTGRPSSGVPQLELANNVAQSGVVDDFNDFQLLLFRDALPAPSYGLGIQPGTLFLNSAQQFRFYGASALLMELGQNSSLNSNLTVSGNVKVNGTFSYDGIFFDNSDCRRVGRDVTDCYCPANAVAISGGAEALGGNELRESRYIESGGRSAWRMACGGPDAIGHCGSTHVMCAPLLP
ncbi:MAG: hypothetical protein AAFX99_23765 [Myxococcota bacterium]